MIRAVLFDVDFTLIAPGPMFRGEGYQAFCARYGMVVDPSLFPSAVASAAALLDAPDDTPYDAEIFVAYTRHIIERMGGAGPAVDPCAREIYAEWAACQHFDLYDDVPGALRNLKARGVQVGLVSNSHRCLASFQSHFGLGALVDAAISSPDHGFMKPHPTIFAAALELMDVAPADALMVGDSVRQDIDGAQAAGMRAVLLHRAESAHPQSAALAARGVPTIRSLAELAGVLEG
ncbi:MAG: HAD family hydrolase [Acidobacteriota bacterium]